MVQRPGVGGGLPTLESPFGSFVADDATGAVFRQARLDRTYFRSDATLFMQDGTNWEYMTQDAALCASGPCEYRLASLQTDQEEARFEWSGDQLVSVTGLEHGSPLERWRFEYREGPQGVRLVSNATLESRDEDGQRWVTTRRVELAHQGETLTSVRSFEGDTADAARTWTLTYYSERPLTEVPVEAEFNRLLRASQLDWHTALFEDKYVSLADYDLDGRIDAQIIPFNAFYTSGDGYSFRHEPDRLEPRCSLVQPHQVLSLPGINGGMPVRVFAAQADLLQIRLTVCSVSPGEVLSEQTLELPAVTPLGAWQSSIGTGAPLPVRTELEVVDVGSDRIADLLLVTTDGFVSAAISGATPEAPFGPFTRSSAMGPLRDGARHQLVDIEDDDVLDFVELSTGAPAKVFRGERGRPHVFAVPVEIPVATSRTDCGDGLTRWLPFDRRPSIVRICQTPSLQTELEVFAYEAGQGWVKKIASKAGNAVILPGGFSERGNALLTWVEVALEVPDAQNRCPSGMPARTQEPRCPATFLSANELSGADPRSGLLSTMDDGLGVRLAVQYDWTRREPGGAPPEIVPRAVGLEAPGRPAEWTLICYNNPRPFVGGTAHQVVSLYRSVVPHDPGTCDDLRHDQVEEQRDIEIELLGMAPRVIRETVRGRDPMMFSRVDSVWEYPDHANDRLLTRTTTRGYYRQGEAPIEGITSSERYEYLPDNHGSSPNAIHEERDGDVLTTRFGKNGERTFEGRHRDPSRDFTYSILTETRHRSRTTWLEEDGRRTKLNETRWDGRGRVTVASRGGEMPTLFQYDGGSRRASRVIGPDGAADLTWEPGRDVLQEIRYRNGVRQSFDRFENGVVRSTTEAGGEGEALVAEVRAEATAAGLLDRTTTITADGRMLGVSRQVALPDGSAMVLLDDLCSSDGAVDCVVRAASVDSERAALFSPSGDLRASVDSPTQLRELLDDAGTHLDGADRTWDVRIGGTTLSGQTRLSVTTDGGWTRSVERSGGPMYEVTESPGRSKSTWRAIDGASLIVERDVLGRIARLTLDGRETRTYRYHALGVAEVNVIRADGEGPPIRIEEEMRPGSLLPATRTVTAGNVAWVERLTFDPATSQLTSSVSTSQMGPQVAWNRTYLPIGSATAGELQAVRTDRFLRSYAYDALRRVKTRTTVAQLEVGVVTLEETFGYYADGRLASRLVEATHPDGRRERTHVAWELDSKGRVAEVLIDGHSAATIARTSTSMTAANAEESLRMAWFTDGRLAEATHLDGGRTVSSYTAALSPTTGLLQEESYFADGRAVHHTYDYSRTDQLRGDTVGGTRHGFSAGSFGRLDERVVGDSPALRIDRTSESVTSGDHSWTVNSLGIPTSIDGVPVALDARGRIISDGRGGRYVYDDNDLVVAIERDDRYWLGDGDVSVTERGLHVSIDVDQQPIGSVNGGEFVFEARDGRGDRLEDAGADAFGAPVPAEVGARAKGGVALPDLGLIHLGRRAYDPRFGQFGSPDLWMLANPDQCARDPRGCDLFAYTGGDPINYADPSGARRIQVTIVTRRDADAGQTISSSYTYTDTWIDLPEIDPTLCVGYPGGCADPIVVGDALSEFGPYPGYLPGATPSTATVFDRAETYRRLDRDASIGLAISALLMAGALMPPPAAVQLPQIEGSLAAELQEMADALAPQVSKMFPQLVRNPKEFGKVMHEQLRQQVIQRQLKGELPSTLMNTGPGRKGVDYYLASGRSIDLMTVSLREFSGHVSRYVGNEVNGVLIRELTPIYYLRYPVAPF